MLPDGADYFILPGDVLLYEPGAAQDYSTAQQAGHWHLAFAHVGPRAKWRDWLNWPLLAARTRLAPLGDVPSVQRQVLQALRRLIRRAQSRFTEPFAEDLAFNAFEEALIWINQGLSAEGRMRDPRVQKALDYIAESIREPVSVGELATHCGISESRLAHLFKEEMGMPVARFTERERLHRAARLLRLTRLSVGEIAAECGYDNAFHFSNRFKAQYGGSPSHYRDSS